MTQECDFMHRTPAAVVTASAVAAAASAIFMISRRRRTLATQVRMAADLDTPALLLDLDALEYNISALASFMQKHGLLWRPHCKAIRSAEIARRMIRAGACGVTCAKVSQAVALCDCGITDILIANEIVGDQKIKELVRLALRAVVCVAVDDMSNLRELSAAAVAGGAEIAVLIDVDAGMGRCGVPYTETAVIVGLCRLACELPGITLRGLMGYDGHTQAGAHREREAATVFGQRLRAVRAAVEAAGVPIGLVSGAGSGNYARAAQLGSVDEVQAGGGIFCCQAYQSYHDNWTSGSEVAGFVRLRPCLHIVSQVVSLASPGRAVADCGFKTAFPMGGVLPRCVSHAGLKAAAVNAEHCIFDVSPDASPSLKLGSRLVLQPAYSDSATLLHRNMYGVRGGHSTSTRAVAAHRADPAAMQIVERFDLTLSIGALA